MKLASVDPLCLLAVEPKSFLSANRVTRDTVFAELYAADRMRRANFVDRGGYGRCMIVQGNIRPAPELRALPPSAADRLDRQIESYHI